MRLSDILGNKPNDKPKEENKDPQRSVPFAESSATSQTEKSFSDNRNIAPQSQPDSNSDSVYLQQLLTAITAVYDAARTGAPLDLSVLMATLEQMPPGIMEKDALITRLNESESGGCYLYGHAFNNALLNYFLGH